MEGALFLHQAELLSELLSVPISIYLGDERLGAYAPYRISFDVAEPWRALLGNERENPCFVLTDELILYGEVRAEADGLVLGVGPVRLGRINESAVQRLAAGSPALQGADIREIMLYLNACESFSSGKFSALLKLLYSLVNCRIAEEPPDPYTMEMHAEFHRSGELQDYGAEAFADYEKKILYYVQHGLTAPLKQMQTYMGDVPDLADTPLRMYKNALIILNSLCQRAAIAGGLEPEIGHRLGFAYIRRIEACQTVAELVQLNKDMRIAADYSERVAEIVCPDVSDPHIQKAIRHIRRNFQKKLSVEEIASEVHLSKEYLSSRFHAETGMTMRSYIANQKVIAAKELLTFTDMSIIDIACFLSFSSQSYFQSVFKKRAGETPQEYRRRTQRRR